MIKIVQSLGINMIQVECVECGRSAEFHSWSDNVLADAQLETFGWADEICPSCSDDPDGLNAELEAETC